MLIVFCFHAEAYSEPFETSTMKSIAKILNGYKSLTILAKRFMLEVSQGSE